MKNDDKLSNRDEVLYAFFIECEKPTLADIETWIEKYPEFADDIRDHAAVALDNAAGLNDGDDVELTDVDYARGHSLAMNAVFKAGRAAENKVGHTAAAPQTLQDLFQNSGLTIPEIARLMSLPRGILADYVGGRMQAPAGRKFTSKLSETVKVPFECITLAHQETLRAKPQRLVAKAATAPTVNIRSYEEIIRSSNLTPEEIEFWLADE